MYMAFMPGCLITYLAGAGRSVQGAGCGEQDASCRRKAHVRKVHLRKVLGM